MGKTRKKKAKKAELQKVKLKLGKKLPKGTLVDTTFKAKKIIIRDQLTEKVDAIGRVDKNVKDYLNKLQHYSSTVRVEAVRHVKECLTDHPHLIHSQLNVLIERLSALLTDSHEIVRKQGVSLLKLIFSIVTSQQIQPFISVIVAHLRCALTHLTHDIHYDGLAMVDLLVDVYPQHLKSFFKDLLQDFLNQISNKIRPFLTASTKNSHNNKPTLTSDPSRKIVGVQFYFQVCTRVKNVLEAIFGKRASSSLTDSGKVIKWASQTETCYPIYGEGVKLVVNSEWGRLKEFFEDLANLKSIASTLMPLMLEVWIEVSTLSGSSKKKGENDAIDMHICIAEIVLTIWMMVERWEVEENESNFVQWFVNSYGKRFIERCMRNFPYSSHSRPTKEMHNVSQSKAVHLNIMLCRILAYSIQSSSGGKSDHFDTVNNYLVSIFADGNSLTFSNIESAVLVLRKILEQESAKDNEKLIECVITGILQQPSGYQCKPILDLLVDINTFPQYSHICRLPLLIKSISDIPANLVKLTVVPWKLLEVLTLFAPRRYSDFLQCLMQYFPHVLEKLNSLKFDCDEPIAAQRMIISMLYWIPKVDAKMFLRLSTLCHDVNTAWDLSCYILDVLNNRSLRYDPTTWCDGKVHYISFLLSVALGVTKAELQETNSLLSVSNYTNSFEILNFARVHHIVMDSKDRLPHYQKLTKLGMNSFQLLNVDSDGEHYIAAFLKQILEGYSSVSLRSAYAILYIVSQVWHSKNLPEHFLPSLLSLSLSFLEHLVKVEGMAKEFFEVVKGIMTVPQLSDSICSKLVTLASDELNKDVVAVLGEIALLLIKSSNLSHTNTLWYLLRTLKRNNEDDVKNMLWYISGKYELFSQDCNLKD